MDKNLNKIIETLKQIHLSTSERDEMRQKLILAINESKNISNNKPAQKDIWQWFYVINKSYLSVAMLLLIIFSGGVTFAAEKSLPGDLLYVIKTGVNENVLRVLNNTSAIKRANFETDIMKERLIEAEYLDKEMRLDQSNGGEIQRVIINQQNRIEKAINRLVITASATVDINVEANKAENVKKNSQNIEGQNNLKSSDTENRGDSEKDISKNDEAEKAIEKANNVFKGHSQIIDKIGLYVLNSENGEQKEKNNYKKERNN